MPKQHERDKLRQTNVRLSPLGNRLLDTLVEYHGVNKTAIMDMLLRDHARDLGLLVAPGPVATLEAVGAEPMAAISGEQERTTAP